MPRVSPRRIRSLREQSAAGRSGLFALRARRAAQRGRRGRDGAESGRGSGDRARALRRLAATTGAVLVAAGVLVTLAYGTSVLGVRTVSVLGTKLTSEEAVLTAAAVTRGTPLARVDTGAVERRVGALPAVASVRVSRLWPSTVVIDVTERVGVAVIDDGGGLRVIDGGGIGFATVAQRGDLPLLRVDRPGPNDPSTRAGLRVLAALTPQLRAVLVAVQVPSPGGIRLELTGSRVVIWGDADDSERKAQVATALLARPVATIDVSTPDVAVTS